MIWNCRIYFWWLLPIVAVFAILYFYPHFAGLLTYRDMCYDRGGVPVDYKCLLR